MSRCPPSFLSVLVVLLLTATSSISSDIFANENSARRLCGPILSWWNAHSKSDRFRQLLLRSRRSTDYPESGAIASAIASGDGEFEISGYSVCLVGRSMKTGDQLVIRFDRLLSFGSEIEDGQRISFPIATGETSLGFSSSLSSALAGVAQGVRNRLATDPTVKHVIFEATNIRNRRLRRFLQDLGFRRRLSIFHYRDLILKLEARDLGL